jgi:hypothetical protein
MAILFAMLLVAAPVDAALDGETNTNGLNPAAELYDIAETKRLQQVGQQLELNRFMTWSAYYGPNSLWGPPLGGPPVRQPIGYESKEVSPDRWIYRPLYGDEQPAAELIGTPPATGSASAQSTPPAQPKLPAPSDAQSGDRIGGPLPPQPQVSVPSGPRDF